MFVQKDAETAGVSASETGAGDADTIVVVADSAAAADTADEPDDEDEKQERTP